MGGNKGKRTKGNVKPSSSGRTAELLSASGVTGFVGFSGLATDLPGFVLPIGKQSENEEVDVSVDTDFRLVLKKATKRDTVTKVKALQEFAQLCQTKDEETVKGVLPFWPRLYTRLAIDHDRRVREATHQAHKSLVEKVKKNIAPYLKSLMGVWVVSMCDLYAPAACASKQAFQIAFPVAKQAGVMDFCKDEIINYMEDILYKQTPTTLSDPKACDEEEMDSKYLRLLAGCFNGLKLFLTFQGSTKNEQTEILLSRILNEPKYWKYAKHKEPEIRRAWFSLLPAFSQNYPNLVKENAGKVCPLTLGVLGEDHPIVAPVVWEAILHVLVVVEDCWEHINIKSAFLPQLWSTLTEGGKGNAGVTFQSILPLLSKLPDSVIEPRIPFYERFYGCFRNGMKYDKSLSSISELKSIIKAYFECLRFSLLNHLSTSETDINCRNYLITEQLVPLIKESLLNEESELYSILFCDLGEFLQFLDGQAQKSENSEKAILTEILLQFLSKFFEVSKEILENDTPLQENLLGRLSLFFHSLYAVPKRKKATVRFQREDETSPEISTVRSKELILSNSVQKSSEGVLSQQTLNFCRIVYRKLNETPKLPFLKLLSETIRVVPSPKLFLDLLKEQDTTKCPEIESEAPLEFVKWVLIPWLEKKKELFGNENLAVECVISVTLSACFCSNEDLALNLLDEIGKAQDPLLLEKLVVEAAKLRKSEPILRKWLKGDFVGKLMVGLAELISKQLLENENQSENLELGRKLLHICFAATKDFDPIISSDYMNTILTSFTSALSSLLPICISQKLKTSERIVQLVCDLALNLFESCQGCWLLPAVESLLVSLFNLSCCSFDQNSTTSLILEETWILGTKRLVELQGLELTEDKFLYQAIISLKQILTITKFSYDKLEEVMVLSEKLVSLLKACEEGIRLRDDSDAGNVLIEEMFTEILGKVLPSFDEWNNVETCFISMCSIPSVQSAPFCTALPLMEINTEVLPNDLPQYLAFAIFTTNVFKILIDKPVNENEDTINKKYLKPQLIKHLQNLIMAVQFAERVHIAPQILSGHKIRLFCSELTGTVSSFLKELSFEDVEFILNESGKRALAGSFSHSISLPSMIELCLRHFDKVQRWCGRFCKEHELLQLITESDYSALNTIHCLLPNLSTSIVSELFSVATNHLLCDEIWASQGNRGWCLDILADCLNSQRPEIFAMDSIQENLTIVLEFLVDLRKRNPEIFNPKWNNGGEQIKIEFVTQIGSIFFPVIKHFPQLLSPDVWDMILCIVVNWTQRCNDCKSQLLLESVLYLPTAITFQLLCLIQKTFSKFKNGCGGPKFMTSLLLEWEELYMDVLFSIILPLFLDLGDSSSKVPQTVAVNKILSSISKLFNELPTDLLFKCVKEQAAKISPVDNLPVELSYLLQRLYPVFMLGNRALVFGSHAILFSIMHKIPELQILDDQSEEQEEKSRPPPNWLIKTLQITSQIVEAMLLNFQVGDCCLVQPYTDSFTFTFVYLLAWIQMLELFGAANSEVRSEYAVFLDRSKLLEGLLFNLFRLMPINPGLSPESPKGHSVKTMFTEPLFTDVDEEATFAELQRLACHVFLTTLRQLPALVRQWWHNQDKRTAEIVNRYTTNYVSSCISLQEIKAVQETDTKFPNMTVKGRPVAREVVARYSMEEITIELVIKLPPNHPLGPVSVETSQRVGVGITQWRNWMLQLTTFLTHQNGSILDGLSLWKRNVDKRFEGIEECMICFYVLHGATCQLPKLTCRTCKKRFHSACLYKWFSTSQNSTCPLCRNLF